MTKKKIPLTPAEKTHTYLTRSIAAVRTRTDAFLARRPHRSFRMTKKRDYARSMKLPGYWAFTNHVRATVWRYRKTLLLVSVIYALLTAALIGIASQDTYSSLTDTLQETGGQIFEGDFAAIGQASLLFMTAATGGLSPSLSETQSVYAGLIFLLTWLTTVWLLRNLLADRAVKLRDGLYNAGAPIISTVIVMFVMVAQLLPLAIALIAYAAASASGLLAGGVEAMLFWLAAGALMLLSLYWITSTFFALIIVTLPGMYPGRALKSAGDIVVGRRMRILLRLVWLAGTIIIGWAVIMIPVILIDTWIKSLWPSISGVPVIPVILLIMSSLTVVWGASYVYLLYRKVVADDADPA